MTLLEFSQFVLELADGYEHIYDLVYLRTHPFIKYFFGTNQASTKDNAWQLHHTLLNAIQELDPGPQVPVFSREWRRHRLMILRYVDGLAPQAVADQLAISRRHYYREHEGAIDTLADILWKRYNLSQTDVSTESATSETPLAEIPFALTDRMELLRLEAAQLVQIERRTRLPEVIRGVLALLADKADKRELTIVNHLAETTPEVWGDYRLMRQLLLGLIGHLINVSRHGTIDISFRVEEQRLHLAIAVLPGMELTGSINADPQTPLSIFEELATLNAATLLPIPADENNVGFLVSLSLYAGRRTVLIVDDNDDILELFQRYLKPHNYEVVTVGTSSEMLKLAKHIRPSAIILDLMIPDQDGWDLLQILLNQPETQSIPVIICSVLRQRELALSLGATAFLEKPVSEIKLLAVLDMLVGDI